MYTVPLADVGLPPPLRPGALAPSSAASRSTATLMWIASQPVANNHAKANFNQQAILDCAIKKDTILSQNSHALGMLSACFRLD